MKRFCADYTNMRYVLAGIPTAENPQLISRGFVAMMSAVNETES